MKNTKPASIKTARSLRHNQTEAEKALWLKLRNSQSGFKFRRQYPIGPYIADFVCIEKKLVIELDGGQHTPEADQARTDFIKNSGYAVLRFWNSDVLNNIDGAYDIILENLQNP